MIGFTKMLSTVEYFPILRHISSDLDFPSAVSRRCLEIINVIEGSKGIRRIPLE